MIGAAELLDHLAASLAVWLAATIAGFALAPLLPARLRTFDAWATWPLLGLAYWSASLYLFPFAGGMAVAGAVALTAAWLALSWKRPRCHWKSVAILLAGVAPYATPLFTQYVPPGMDASMHATHARLIAYDNGPPTTYAPILDELPLPPVNLGSPALAAVAVMTGASPVGATLAVEQFSFGCLILGVYLLLRLTAPRTRSAVLAVACAWFARAIQDTFEWGGVPTVAGTALGLFAARLLIETQQSGRGVACFPLGLTIAATPIVHGIAAASWLYVVAPIAAVYGFCIAGDRLRATAALGGSGLVAAAILGVYLLVAKPSLDPSAVEWIRASQADYAPKGDGWGLLLSLPGYVARSVDHVLAWLGTLAFAAIIVRRQWKPAAMFGAFAVLLSVAVANSKHWILPASELLYPERTLYWAAPAAALAMAFAWRSVPRAIRLDPKVAAAATVGLLVLAGARHNHYFQRKALRPVITEQEWAALVWCSEHLEAGAIVEAPYDSAGSYLPTVAGIATTGWHVHIAVLERLQRLCKARTAEYRLDLRSPPSRTAGPIAFSSDQVRLIGLAPQAADANNSRKR